MPVPLIAAGISAIGSFAGSKIASNAADKATAAQVGSANTAMNTISDASKVAGKTLASISGQQQSNLSPFISQGSSALARLTTGLTPRGTPQPATAGPTTLASFASPGAPQGGQMVTLRGTDGVTKQFQAGDPAIQHWQQKGAQVVQ